MKETNAERTSAPVANPADVASIDAIITAAYDVISGPAGQKRDWDRERSLFIPGARLISTTAKPGVTRRGGFVLRRTGDEGQVTSESKIAPQVLDVEAYIARVDPDFEKNGFFETEIARRTEQFGHIAHVWSTYESRHKEDDPEPFMRGINSIQLLYDDKRWWIITIYWQHESPEDQIPAKYL
jgi:hypothetical protein